MGYAVVEVNVQKFRKTECPKCGKQHTCCLGVHCWCASFDIPSDLSDMQNLMYNECLCKECLEQEILDYKRK